MEHHRRGGGCTMPDVTADQIYQRRTNVVVEAYSCAKQGHEKQQPRLMYVYNPSAPHPLKFQLAGRLQLLS